MATSRGRLTGISIPKSANGSLTDADTNRLTDIIEKAAIRDNTAYGEVRTPSEAAAVHAALSTKAPQTLYTQEKLLDYENMGHKTQAALADVNQNVDLFDSDLKAQLKDAAGSSINNMQNLIGNYAQIYTDAAEKYQANVADKVLSRYEAPPAGVMTYLADLKKKATMYSGLYNSYQMKDASGEYGVLDPNAYAVLVDTNPANGKISNVEIVPVGDAPAGYMRTDVGTNVFPSSDSSVKAKQLPMYLRGEVSGTDGSGKNIYTATIGGLKFSATASADGSKNATLSLQRTDEGSFFHKLFTPDNAPAIKSQGLFFDDTAAFQFDKNAIPDNSIVHVGSKTYFQSSGGDLFNVSGKDSNEMKANLTNFMKMKGVDPANVHDFYAAGDYVYKPDGTTKVQGAIDANLLKVGPNTQPPVSTGPTSMLDFTGTRPPTGGTMPTSTAAIASAPPAVDSGSPLDKAASFFGGRKNTPAVPDKAVASRGNTPISGNDVIAGGESFFKKVA